MVTKRRPNSSRSRSRRRTRIRYKNPAQCPHSIGKPHQRQANHSSAYGLNMFSQILSLCLVFSSSVISLSIIPHKPTSVRPLRWSFRTHLNTLRDHQTSVESNDETRKSSKAPSTSPWSPSEWQIHLNIGRERDTEMSEGWGASGARLPMSVNVLFESEDFASSIDDEREHGKNEEKDQFQKSSSLLMLNEDGGIRKKNHGNLLSVLEDPTYVSLKGQQTVNMKSFGAWRLFSRRTDRVGDAQLLRFWFQLASPSSSTSCPPSNNQNVDDDLNVDSTNNMDVAAQRNDVTLEWGDVLVCTANCWRERELEAGKMRMKPLWNDWMEAQQFVEEQLSHETGDRRLDGVDLIETAKASVDMAFLISKRDDLARRLSEAKLFLPYESKRMSLSEPGHWPGSTEPITIARGKIILVRQANRKIGTNENGKGVISSFIPFLGSGDETLKYDVVGTWTASPVQLSEDEEYVYYDVDENEGDS